MALVDAHQGQTSAIGPQDGAYILPLACGGQADYRPVAQAACQAFCGLRPFPDGSWDEMSAWLGVPLAAVQTSNISASAGNGVLHMPGQDSWAYLRAVNFHSRPGHADQLHLDLWWRGLNLALDPGSYLYNAAPPWDNSLARTAAHNTLQVAGREQMTWAGRFLWLDRAQGRYTGFEQTPDGRMVRLVAEHDGYRSLGVTFRRAVTASSDGCWRVEDSLPRSNRAQADENVACSLHWLLPDWEWDLQGPDRIVHLTLQSPLGPVSLKIWLAGDDLAEQIQGALRPSLYRGGEQIYGDGPDGVTRGWFAPTYGVKLPALSLVVPIAMTAQLTLISEWQLPAG
jgi:hypothetical protein